MFSYRICGASLAHTDRVSSVVLVFMLSPSPRAGLCRGVDPWTRGSQGATSSGTFLFILHQCQNIAWSVLHTTLHNLHKTCLCGRARLHPVPQLTWRQVGNSCLDRPLEAPTKKRTHHTLTLHGTTARICSHKTAALSLPQTPPGFSMN